MDAKTLFQLNESYHHGVYNQIDEEVLSEEELLDIQEWVEALIEEGYDLDEYTDEELYEAYLDEVRGGGKIDPVSGFPKHGEKVSRTPQEAGLLMSPLDRAKARENALRKRGNTKQANQIQSRFIRPTERGVNRAIHASNVARADEKKRLMSPQNEEFDLYDLVSEYLVSEGFCDSYEDADVIMANMSEEWRDGIVEEILEGFKPTGYSMGYHSSVTGRGRKARQIDRQIEKLKRSGKKGEAMAVDFVNRMQDTPEGRAEVMAISRQNKSRSDARALRDAQRDSRG